jgi:hypothetical protein
MAAYNETEEPPATFWLHLAITSIHPRISKLKDREQKQKSH